MKVVLEISDRKGTNASRLSIPKLGLTIGRAWDSDILIQDKFVDSHHLTISAGEDNALLIKENNSLNGTLLNQQRVPSSEHPYPWGAKIHIGDTTLRFLEVTTEVVETEPRSKWFSTMAYFQSWRSLMLIAACAIIAQVVQKSTASRTSFDASDGALEAITIGSTLLVWSLLFGGLSKLIRGQSNMRAHLALISLYILFVVLSGFLISIVRFNLQSLEVGEAISILIVGLGVLILMFGLLTYMTHLEGPKKWFWSALAMTIVCLIPYKDRLMNEEHEQWLSGTRTETTMLPPSFLIRGPNGLDDYFKRSQKLFETYE